MWLLAILPFALQALAIALDEGVFHIKRGLPLWERIGHPLDTLSVLVCMLFVLWIPYSPGALKIYIGLAIFSSILITKDEFVHKHHCPGTEQWLHALLFILHPITLTAAGLIWPVAQGASVAPWLARFLDNPPQLALFLKMQAILMSCFLTYQIIFWNFVWQGTAKKL